jgi:serine phosphatase RsbU (regulator of sigma subunit)/anti-sigma regulatory factor (Ser/Thr protein kinase)
VTSGKRKKKPEPTPTTSPSVRNLVLGIDHSGRIVQHDRTAPQVLARPPGQDLLGVMLPDLAQGDISSLLEAIKADREGRAVLTIDVDSGTQTEAVVTVRPMRAEGSSIAALATLQIPVATAERFVDPALMRDALLREAFSALDDTLDFDHLAGRLMDKLVPHFCNAADLVILESLVGPEEFPAHGPDGNFPLRRLTVAHDRDDPAWEAAFPVGEILRYPEESPHVRSIESGEPVLENLSADDARKLARSWRRPPVSKLLSGTSVLILPMVARGTVLGFFACVRLPGFHRFYPYDARIGMEFASRAALFFDSARRYNREHATALTLQRSLLPTGLSAPSSVEVKHRYLPGSKLVEVGGDWYESIALPGARVALVVGDVAGHGVRAAVTMGRLRTAIQTLAMLELPPGESLQQLDELMHILGEREPHFATCAYAVYDAVSGECEVAIAGHLPPLLVNPDGSNELIDVPPSPPLGIGEGPVESRKFTIEDGSLFLLYTDGLVESRGRDISDGLARLRETFGPGSPSRSLEDLCKSALDGVYADHQRDDIAVLIARLHRVPEDMREVWKLPPKLTSVKRARELLAEPMERWGLTELLPVTELLVSELVTNALRYAKGQVGLRLVREAGVVCAEVHDNSPALPRVLQAGRDDENGRGLQVVSQLASRWGARRTQTGKVVWCEQAVPAGVPAAPSDEAPAGVAADKPVPVLAATRR